MNQRNQSKWIKHTGFCLFFIAFFFSVSAQTFSEIVKAVASDRVIDDQFGRSVSIDGNYAIIGATYKDDTVGGNTILEAGAAYIFKNDGNDNWIEIQKLTASDKAMGDQFGASVSIDGNYAIIGAIKKNDTVGGNTISEAGAAYIFKNDDNDNWVEIQKLTASDKATEDLFGVSVEIDGNYVIIGASLKDVVGGNTLTNTGAAYIFKNDGNDNWTEVQKIAASDQSSYDGFGVSVAIDSDYAIVGAYFKTPGGGSLFFTGAAYVFKNDGMDNWTEIQKLTASDENEDGFFGRSVVILNEYAIVGADFKKDTIGGNIVNNVGAAYIFKNDGNDNWIEIQKLTASDKTGNDFFGVSIAIDGDYVVIGAGFKNDTVGGIIVPNVGAIYVFKNDGMDNWTEIQKLIASDKASNNHFGYDVAISGVNIVIGSWGNDIDTVGGNPLDNTGGAYFYKGTFPVSTETLPIPQSLTLYPNPTTGILYFEKQPTSVTVIDQLGRIAGFYEPTAPQINLAHLPNGLYFLRVNIDEEWLTAKVVKQ